MAGEEVAEQELLKAGGQAGMSILAGGGDAGRGGSVTENHPAHDSFVLYSTPHNFKRFPVLVS